MDFQYQADTTDGIKMTGCVEPHVQVYEVFRFRPGTTVYICQKATRGVLERVTIKYIELIKNQRTLGRFVPLYVDTLNSIYNEDELCTETQAIEYATLFYARQLDDIDDQTRKCPPHRSRQNRHHHHF